MKGVPKTAPRSRGKSVIETADVVIIGGGVVGNSIAWHLARRKAGRIILLEKER
ncbi:MAG: FAD-dependent oxidoreductase, partial [Acidobacteriota bacterium]